MESILTAMPQIFMSCALRIATVIQENLFMRLIYLGHTFQRPAPTSRTYRKPYAVNWRYQIPGEAHHPEVPPAATYLIPKVVSWRWQVLTS